MATTTAPNPPPSRRHFAPVEKRQIVELTLCTGASVVAIAREYDVHPNRVYQWRMLYRAGKLDAQVPSAPRISGSAASATFFPVSVVPQVRRPEPTTPADAVACRSGIVQLILASGATLRIETGVLDTALLCALIAELQR